MATLLDLSQQEDLKSIHLLSKPQGITECNCEPVLCFLRSLLRFPQLPSLPRVRADSHSLLTAPVPRRERRQESQSSPLPKQSKSTSWPHENQMSSLLSIPLVSTAAAPPLLREGYNVPRVRSRVCECALVPSFRDTKCFPTSGHVSFCDQGRWPWPLQGVGGREGTHLVHGTWFKSVTQRQVCETFFKTSYLGTFPFSLPNLLMPPGTSGINKLTYLKHPVRH